MRHLGKRDTDAFRDRLRELSTLRSAACNVLSNFCAARFASQLERRHSPSANSICSALFCEHNPSIASVRETARQIGWSERRFSQVFREEVGLAPKVWCRIQRFQRAVRQLHAGADIRWAELALDCGYYDQSHFANEFRAFSGVDATTYSARRTLWANHIAAE